MEPSGGKEGRRLEVFQALTVVRNFDELARFFLVS